MSFKTLYFSARNAPECRKMHLNSQISRGSMPPILSMSNKLKYELKIKNQIFFNSIIKARLLASFYYRIKKTDFLFLTDIFTCL